MTDREKDLLFALIIGAAGSMVFGWLLMYVSICGALGLFPALILIMVGVFPQLYCIRVVMGKGAANANRSAEKSEYQVR